MTAPSTDMTPGAGMLDQASDGGLTPTGSSPEATVEERKPRRRKIVLLLLLLLAFAILLGVAIWYLLFRQPIIPIPAIPGQTVMPGYVTSIYGPSRPMGGAVTADGSRVYVGETAGDRTARVFDGNGQQLGTMLPPVSTGTDHVPVYVAWDAQTGEVYVSDRPTGAIYIYGADGTFLREFTPPAELKGWQPLAMTFDGAGNLYVSDVSKIPQTVIEFDRSGSIVRTFGDSAELSFPNGIGVDGRGYLYVSDSNNGRLVVFNPQGDMVGQVGRGVGDGKLGMPRGVAVASDRVYVADATGQGVQVYGTYSDGDRSLTYLGTFGTEGVGDGQFEYPNGLAVDGRGRVYVVDTANNRVQVWSY